MWYKIKQGRHRAYPLSLGIHTGKTSESYEVIFDDSCKYTLDEENQEDWNKLVGWSYGILPTLEREFYTEDGEASLWKDNWIAAHHTNSIRIGWRYNVKNDGIQLALYMYHNGERIIYDSMIYPLNKKIFIDLSLSKVDKGLAPIMKINTESGYGSRTIYSSNSKIPYFIPKWGYNLGLYFGGSCTQPNKTMKVWIKKLKKH